MAIFTEFIVSDMSFAGHVFDMLNRFRYNQSMKNALRDRRREYLKRYHHILLDATRKNDYKKLSHEELLKIRAELKKQAEKEMLKLIAIAAAVVLLAGVPAAYLIITYLF
jgi:hypothetical protein